MINAAEDFREELAQLAPWSQRINESDTLSIIAMEIGYWRKAKAPDIDDSSYLHTLADDAAWYFQELNPEFYDDYLSKIYDFTYRLTLALEAEPHWINQWYRMSYGRETVKDLMERQAAVGTPRTLPPPTYTIGDPHLYHLAVAPVPPPLTPMRTPCMTCGNDFEPTGLVVLCPNCRGAVNQQHPPGHVHYCARCDVSSQEQILYMVPEPVAIGGNYPLCSIHFTEKVYETFEPYMNCVMTPDVVTNLREGLAFMLPHQLKFELKMLIRGSPLIYNLRHLMNDTQQVIPERRLETVVVTQIAR